METLSWLDVDGMVGALKSMLADERLDAVVGIARSGLIPAVMLSHVLGIRDFGVLDIRRTLNDEVNALKRDPVLRGQLNLEALRGRRVLLVDDVIGAGATMLAARAELQLLGATVTSAALVLNEANLGTRRAAEVVDHIATVVRGWVVFPWEGKHAPGLSVLAE
jgi:hypoxanthine phosphoribosyltransferase